MCHSHFNDLHTFYELTILNIRQGVGVLFALEKSIRLLDETNQEFLLKVLQKIHSRLTGLFSRFLDDQVRAIEDTKVKIKKRKGVIAFMKIFPQFAARIEDQLPPSTQETGVDSTQSLGIRGMVDRGYRMINKAMFESLQAIARESGFSTGAGLISTTAVVGGPGVPFGGADPEDKEQLNYHIMMIENMNHYVEDVDTRGNIVLGDFMRRAEVEYKEHLGMYLTAVVRRPLGRLLVRNSRTHKSQNFLHLLIFNILIRISSSPSSLSSIPPRLLR